MKRIYGRELTEKERETLEQGVRSASAFTVRRSQILLSSAIDRRNAREIAEHLRISDQCVRNVIRAFEQEGLACLEKKSSARQDNQSAFEEPGLERLQGLVRESPRKYGHESSIWTLETLAETCWAEGISTRPVSVAGVSGGLRQLGIDWQRARHRINSPDPHYAHKKKRRDQLKAHAKAHPDWLLVDQDECWFSRFAQPDLHAWAASGEALRLIARTPASNAQDKALACYGARRQDTDEVFLYLCDGQPKSEFTWLMIERLLTVARQEKKRVLAIIWDHASWHKSKRLKRWIRTYNQQAKRQGDVRLLTLLLPKQSPWLNPIEPCWLHAKRKVCEPDGDLRVDELRRRLCAHFQTDAQTATLKLSDSVMH